MQCLHHQNRQLQICSQHDTTPKSRQFTCGNSETALSCQALWTVVSQHAAVLPCTHPNCGTVVSQLAAADPTDRGVHGALCSMRHGAHDPGLQPAQLQPDCLAWFAVVHHVGRLLLSGLDVHPSTPSHAQAMQDPAWVACLPRMWSCCCSSGLCRAQQVSPDPPLQLYWIVRQLFLIVSLTLAT